MPLQRPLALTLTAISDRIFQAKSDTDAAIAAMQAGPVTTDAVFRYLDQLRTLISQINVWKVVPGLDAQAAAQSGYAGTLSADLVTYAAKAQLCIDWVVANFPASGGFLQSHQLAADGSRTPRSFSTAQTAGFQTALQTLSAALGA